MIWSALLYAVVGCIFVGWLTSKRKPHYPKVAWWTWLYVGVTWPFGVALLHLSMAEFKRGITRRRDDGQ